MEDFVPFEIAKKLKEKGFKEKCIAYYWEKINEHTPSFVVEDNMPEDGVCILDFISEHNKSEWSPFIDAPTISQVLKWLREECGIFILVEPDILSPEYKLTFTLRVKFYIKGEEDEGFSEKYLTYRKDSYEQAALAGIEYVIDNLI